MDLISGRFLEQFTVGDTIKHWPGKTVTESDNNLFCLLTMNHHPVHLDREYAAGKQHGEILVVGTYVASLTVGMSVRDISYNAIANLDYEKITHDAPVFIGDTLHTETEILDIRYSKSKPDRGIMYVESRTFNQNNVKVLTLRRHILIPRKGDSGNS